MLQLLKLHDTSALVFYETELKDFPEITDWSVDYETFTYMRLAYIGVSSGVDEVRLKQMLASRPDACIYNLVAHNPFMSKTDKVEDIETRIREQRIIIEGKPYIDMFGLHVYITSRVAWDKRSDVDLRFSTNQYPYQRLPVELDLILTSDYDILSRPGSSKSTILTEHV